MDSEMASWNGSNGGGGLPANLPARQKRIASAVKYIADADAASAHNIALRCTKVERKLWSKLKQKEEESFTMQEKREC